LSWSRSGLRLGIIEKHPAKPPPEGRNLPPVFSPPRLLRVDPNSPKQTVSHWIIHKLCNRSTLFTRESEQVGEARRHLYSAAIWAYSRGDIETEFHFRERVAQLGAPGRYGSQRCNSVQKISA
jgi:hypothetical protein